MARARNIKPSIMDNEDLADLEPLTRLLFIYLWMLADREGRLEDRPKRIAAQALAYDRQADIDAMLESLNSGGFILRYKAGGMDLIQIVAFEKHQNPHIREAASELPAPKQGTTKARSKHNLGSALPPPKPERAGLIPDPGFLIPDSLIVCVDDTPAHTQAKQEFRQALKARPELDPETVFKGFLAHYPPEKRTPQKWVKWVASEKTATVAPSANDPDSRASIEACGQAMGLGKWDELKEPWAAYKARVKGVPA